MIKQVPPPPEPDAFPPPAPGARLLRVKDVLARLGISISTLYRMMLNKEFPRPTEITPGWKAWREAEVDEWIESRLNPPPPPN